MLTPRDWQQIALGEAAELMGTPLAAAKLAEAKRYGALADALEAQRARIESLRGALKTAAGYLYELGEPGLGEQAIDAAGDMEPPL